MKPVKSSRSRNNSCPPAQDVAPYLFHQGTNYRAQDYLGVHREGDELTFRVWAPNAAQVFVVGDFCDWETGIALSRVTEAGVWEGRVVQPPSPYAFCYKFRIVCHDGRVLYKADPYARQMQCPPETASVWEESVAYNWRDAGWLSFRAQQMSNGHYYFTPMNIYEMHLGSWRRHEDNTPLTYTELARELPPYVKQMGYTHVEFMPVMSHPYDASWGYQVCGYFAPDARYGTPQELRALIDALHEAGIGVILDWVPAHFPKDAHGLYEFDGQPLYEYQGKDRMEHRGWGTRCFDVGREEVQCFLVSDALYWIEEFHADGLRVDAVASMLYLDYDRLPGEWTPNVYGDNRSLEAIAFFQKLNRHLRGLHPDVLVIAEESSAYGGITTLEGDGLGFSMKWNMGWMNDTLSYAEQDPIHRKYHHNKMTFPLTYAFSERYVLPISHDEVVHGKRSLLDKMPGEYHQKFANTRVFYAWQMTHPGKKLSFMGNEIGQFREWDFAGQIEWFLLDYETHANMQRYFAALNHFYLEHPALWDCDDGWDGFDWINADMADESIYTYCRRTRRPRGASDPDEELLVVLNFTPVRRESFRMGVPRAGQYCVAFCSESTDLGGSGDCPVKCLHSERIPCDGRENSICFDLPPLAAILFSVTPDRDEPTAAEQPENASHRPKRASKPKQ